MACLAAAALHAEAKELSTLVADQSATRISLALKAEKVLHRGKPLLLVTIRGTPFRLVDKPGGGTDTISLTDRRIAFLPVKVDCDKVTIVAGGKLHAPDAASPCIGERTIDHASAVPIFIAFAYPAPGAATLNLPVTVMDAEAPIEVRRPSQHAVRTPRTGSALAGTYALTTSILVE